MAKRMFTGGEFLLRDIACQDVFTPEDFSDEHKQIADTTEQFVSNEIQPINGEIEAKNFDLLLGKLKECAELGLMMIDAPEEYGGLELDKATSMLVTEKMAFALNFGLTYMCHTGIGMLPLIYYGTAGQKERYLGKLMRAEMIGAYCLTEPGSGSDALGAKSTATLSPDGYALHPQRHQTVQHQCRLCRPVSRFLPRLTRSTLPPSWSNAPLPGLDARSGGEKDGHARLVDPAGDPRSRFKCRWKMSWVKSARGIKLPSMF